jgi:DNA-directed RNA polymerase subunit N
MSMMFPVRCFSCGKVLSDRWLEFVEKRSALGEEAASGAGRPKQDGTVGRPVGKILDDMGVDRMCCRRHYIAHVEVDIRR